MVREEGKTARGRAPGGRRRKTVLCSHPESQGPEAAGPGQDRTLRQPARSLAVGTGPGVPSGLSRTSALSPVHPLCAWDIRGGLRASETRGSHSSPFSAKEPSFTKARRGQGRGQCARWLQPDCAFATSPGFLFFTIQLAHSLGGSAVQSLTVKGTLGGLRRGRGCFSRR